MQYIQNACLIGLIVSSIFKETHYGKSPFTWERIEQHQFQFQSNYNFTDAQCLLQLSLMVTAANAEHRLLNSPLWLRDTPLLYKECPLELISKGISNSIINKPAILGHILYDERTNVLFITFTGTNNACMGALDIDYIQTELTDILNYIPGLKGHNGVYSAYQSIRTELVSTVKQYLPKHPQLIICGHSLGGALSQICALDLAYYEPIHYSFASPLVFNHIGAATFDSLVKDSHRIANISDLVVLSPLPIMPNKDVYCHVGKFIYFQRNMGDYSYNHIIAYILEYDLIRLVAEK